MAISGSEGETLFYSFKMFCRWKKAVLISFLKCCCLLRHGRWDQDSPAAARFDASYQQRWKSFSPSIWTGNCLPTVFLTNSSEALSSLICSSDSEKEQYTVTGDCLHRSKYYESKPEEASAFCKFAASFVTFFCTCQGQTCSICTYVKLTIQLRDVTLSFNLLEYWPL